ncbi:hypothetical protein E2542_SST03259 [Spatholobus suberectus]|nr:hypothetical protein E2542_SST03259 [Spatholobus suberectus]
MSRRKSRTRAAMRVGGVMKTPRSSTVERWGRHNSTHQRRNVVAAAAAGVEGAGTRAPAHAHTVVGARGRERPWLSTAALVTEAQHCHSD